MSDGSVYPCDFYVLDEYKLGNLRDCSLADLSKSKILSSFLQGPRRSTKLCETCRYAQICHGQCKRLNICYFDEQFCGYQAFIQKHEAILRQLAMTL
ncbi:MAG: SPASM domain-containing protein, partial [Holdemania filiformis]